MVGEIIGITDALTTIQVYEETTGLRPGEPVTGTGSPMNVTLGPGILDNIFDGIERPLKAIAEESGSSFISRGSNVPALDKERLWDVTVTVKAGDTLRGGDIYAECPRPPSSATSAWCRRASPAQWKRLPRTGSTAWTTRSWCCGTKRAGCTR